MKKLQPTTQYKKDYKRVKNNPKKLKALKEVLEMLMNEQQIPADYYPHMLQGEYKGCMECHVQVISCLSGLTLIQILLSWCA